MRKSSTAGPDSFRTIAQRMPAKPAVRRTSVTPPGNQPLSSTGRASSQRPLCASLRARSKATEDAGDGAVFDLWVEARAEINKKTRAVTRNLGIEIGQAYGYLPYNIALNSKALE